LTLERFQGRYFAWKVDRSSQSTTLRAGELALACGISTDTLRHYERVGVLPRPQRTRAGYRQYPAAAVARVRMVRRALALGFTLAELARIFGVRERGGAPCRTVRAMAAGKLDEIERQLMELRELRDYWRSLLADWDQQLGSIPEGTRAGLLEQIRDLPSKGRKKR
jgi:MerR family transcriptional regulator, copper efflux regulator